jgi:hypothetical protein
VSPFRRFWWLAVIGALVAAASAALVVYRISFDGFPPDVRERAEPSYTATTQVLVNSASRPILRTAETRIEQTPPQVRRDRSGTVRVARPPEEVTEPPDIETLVDAANLLPLVIESDEVITLRRSMFGSLPGDVSAQALFARETAVGLRPSSVPVIQIEAVAGSRDGAVRLADATVEAFTSWLVAEQEEAKVPPAQRILIERLRSPDITESGANNYWLGVLVLLAVASGFAALIVALHSVFPKQAPALVAERAPVLVPEQAPVDEPRVADATPAVPERVDEPPITEVRPVVPERVDEPPVTEVRPIARERVDEPPVTEVRPFAPKRADDSGANDVVLTELEQLLERLDEISARHSTRRSSAS